MQSVCVCSFQKSHKLTRSEIINHIWCIYDKNYRREYSQVEVQRGLELLSIQVGTLGGSMST
jgi:hypothetical protein